MKDTAFQTSTIPVWDRFVRVFHWSLVLGVTVAAVSGFLLRPTWIDLHIWAGTLASVLLLARVLWGIWGSKNARFSGFVKGPRTVLAHVKELRTGRAARHLGHNPLGALMILALMVTLFLLLLTGLSALGGVFKVGPLGFATDFTIGTYTLSLHSLLAYALLGLVAAHVAGAIFEGRRTRENLVKAMVTGKKEARPGDHDLPEVPGHPILAGFVFGSALAVLVWAGVWFSALPSFGVPAQPLNPAYAEECSACHMAYPPSLLPAGNWGGLMATLDNHFGEDASLGPVATGEITTWLLANAADSVDTKPAHVFSHTNPDAPYAITETPFWKNTHRKLAADLFTRPPIYDNGNCAACHSDAASGAFYPANISIPEEPNP